MHVLPATIDEYTPWQITGTSWADDTAVELRFHCASCALPDFSTTVAPTDDLVFIRDFVMRTIAAQSTIAAVGVWTVDAIGQQTKKAMSVAFEVLPPGPVPPIRAVIDHFGDTQTGLNALTVVIKPLGEATRIYLNGHGVNPIGAPMTYAWYFDQYDPNDLSKGLLTTGDDAGFDPASPALINLGVKEGADQGLHTAYLRSCLKSDANVCDVQSAVIKVVPIPTVLIHGYMSSPSQMDDVRAALNDAGVPTFDLDLRRPAGEFRFATSFNPACDSMAVGASAVQDSACYVSALANGSINSFYQWLQQQAASLDANLSFSQDFAIVEGAGITIPIPTGIVGA